MDSIIKTAQIIVREYSDPPFCCICGKKLELGKVDGDGSKYACYPEGLSLHEKLKHHEKSIRLNPPRNNYIVNFAQNVINYLQK